MRESGGSGDLLVADWDDIEICEPISDVHAKRFKAAEAAVITHSGSYRFPCGDGSSPQSGNAVPRHLRRHRLLSDDFDEADGNFEQVTAIDPDMTEGTLMLRQHEQGRVLLRIHIHTRMSIFCQLTLTNVALRSAQIPQRLCVQIHRSQISMYG